ncbi:unnamed protein product [Timema podura]|uniref:Uncharacterized protein n=1 Tax=Timema podura TaxID=61482 RepID=A0ABN7NNU6_TIMPD|nr:unnamed protein product [Timema podura]
MSEDNILSTLSPRRPGRYIREWRRATGFILWLEFTEVHATRWPANPSTITAMATLRGCTQALRPSPAERWLHQRPGIGEAEFFPRCMAAGCSPKTKKTKF